MDEFSSSVVERLALDRLEIEVRRTSKIGSTPVWPVITGHTVNCAKSIRKYCLRRLDHGSVDDAVNDTFAVAWGKIDLVPEGEAALPWLYGVAYRQIQHTWRMNGRAARLRTRVEAMFERPTDSLGHSLIEDDDRRRVVEAAARLDDVDQEILRLTLREEPPSTPNISRGHA